MAIVSIAASKHIDQVRRRLDFQLKGLESEGFNIDIQEINKGHLTFLGCNVERKNPNLLSSKDILVLCRHYVANALSDVIVEDWEQILVRRILRHHYQCFSKEEQDTIVNQVSENLDGKLGDKNMICRIARKGKVLNKLLEYLDLNDLLIIDGFVNFRLKEYLEELEDAVDQAVDEFLLDREYKEFVNLLKHFTSLQEPKADRIHVYIRPGGVFRLRDDNGKTLEDTFLRQFARDLVGEGIEYEDLLISSLVTMAPNWVSIHQGTQTLTKMGLETLTAVFGERLQFCASCVWCEREGQGKSSSRESSLE